MGQVIDSGTTRQLAPERGSQDLSLERLPRQRGRELLEASGPTPAFELLLRAESCCARRPLDRGTPRLPATICYVRLTSICDVQYVQYVRSRRNRPREHHSTNVRYSRTIIQSRRCASVKSFGRRQASESPRGTNPRCAGRGLWGFDVLVVLGRAVVKRAALHRMRIGRTFPGDDVRDPGALVGVFDDGGTDQRK